MENLVYFPDQNLFCEFARIGKAIFVIPVNDPGLYLLVNKQLIRCSEQLIDQIIDDSTMPGVSDRDIPAYLKLGMHCLYSALSEFAQSFPLAK